MNNTDEDSLRVLTIRKNAQGEIILEVQPRNIRLKSLVKGFLSVLVAICIPVFSFFESLAVRKRLVVTSVGLGIGLGFSVLVTQHPDTLQAFPVIPATYTTPIRATRVTIPSIDLDSKVVTGTVQEVWESFTLESLVHDERSSELGGSTSVVIAEVGLSGILTDLESVALGDTIEVRGSNSALYRYTVTEIRDIRAEHIGSVIDTGANSLVLYKAKNMLRSQLYMLIAQPI